MTEAKMQLILNQYLFKLRHKYITPNACLYFWESDLISVSPGGYIREYEIKLSKSDYKQDFKKLNKHQNHLKRRTSSLSQFWYAIHGFLLRPDEVPIYAGLLRVCEGNYVDIIKPAPRLSRQKISETERAELHKIIYARYWNLRAREDK